MAEVTLELELPISEFLEAMDSGEAVAPDSIAFQALQELGARARWITNYLNCVTHTEEIVRGILGELTLVPLDPTVVVEPPFYAGIGVNLRFGQNVRIGQSCHFEDQGGIRIGSGCIIDSGVYICTLTRGAELSERGNVIPSPVVLQDNVWIGTRSTILPGVTVGAKSVVLPGSVVMYDVLPGTIFGGVPAQYLRDN